MWLGWKTGTTSSQICVWVWGVSLHLNTLWNFKNVHVRHQQWAGPSSCGHWLSGPLPRRACCRLLSVFWASALKFWSPLWTCSSTAPSPSAAPWSLPPFKGCTPSFRKSVAVFVCRKKGKSSQNNGHYNVFEMDFTSRGSHRLTWECKGDGRQFQIHFWKTAITFDCSKLSVPRMQYLPKWP